MIKSGWAAKSVLATVHSCQSNSRALLPTSPSVVTHTLTFFALAVALIAITSTSMCCHRLAFYTAKIALLVT